MNLADNLFAGLKARPTADHHPLGRLAYETYCDPDNPANKLYPKWDQLHPAQQEGWQRAAEAVWTAAFQAGADSIQVGGSIE